MIVAGLDPFGTEHADRIAKALAQLDESERMQWQQFWLAVDAALIRIC